MASQKFRPILFSGSGDNSDGKIPFLITSIFIFSVVFLFIYFLRICAGRRCSGGGGISNSPPSAAEAVDPDAVSFLKPSRGPDCAVCLGSLQEGESEKVKALPFCGHRFHSDCLAEWLETRSSCPICRGCVHPVHSLSHELDSVMWMTD